MQTTSIVQSPSVRDESSLPPLSLKIMKEISKSMAAIQSTKNSIIRRNELKAIQKNIQQLQDTLNTSYNIDKGNGATRSYIELLIEVLQGSKYQFETAHSHPDNSKSSSEKEKGAEQLQRDSISSLGFLLLDVISDEESNELCRERSAL